MPPGQVLGFLTAARDEVEGLEQPDVLLLDQRFEPGPVFDTSVGRTTSPSACMDHGCTKAPGCLDEHQPYATLAIHADDLSLPY